GVDLGRSHDGAASAAPSDVSPRPPGGALGADLHLALADRVLRLHAAADDRDARVHLHERQPEPEGAAAVRRPRQLPGGLPGCNTWQSLSVTLKYALIALPVAVVLPLSVA